MTAEHLDGDDVRHGLRLSERARNGHLDDFLAHRGVMANISTTDQTDTNIHSIAPLLSLDDVAAISGIPKATLYTWRTTHPGRGPVAIHIGRSLRFEHAEVLRWLNALPRDETAAEVG